ncbi:MAG: metal ABC transporter ATP-binding protein [Nocardioides sp.]
MPMTEALLNLTGVGVELGGRPILRGIDLTVRAGEVVTLLGANGSGKSTLVRAVLGLVPVSRGEVRLFGVPRDKFRDWHRVGFVPQRTGATSGVPATVSEVVTAGRLSQRRAFLPLRKADRAIVRDAIEAVGLSAKASDGCSTLSGGQQQRALIARALAAQPDLLVLDEPTAGVDHASQQTFADVVRSLVDRGLTVLLVAHELGPMAELVDRAVVMREGRIAYDGPPLASFTEADADGHAHHPGRPLGDHSPGVSAPLDTNAGREGGS